MNKVGLWKITPTVTGTGASVASDGTVVVSSGGTNFQINGCFPADFVNFKVMVWDYRASAATALFMSMGSSRAGSSHAYGFVSVTTANVLSNFGTGGQDAFEFPMVTRTNRSTGGEITFIAPNLAQETTVTCQCTDADVPFRSMGGMHLADTAYTDLRVATLNTQTITSLNMAFYGYN
jgi:hypothetical protein